MLIRPLPSLLLKVILQPAEQAWVCIIKTRAILKFLMAGLKNWGSAMLLIALARTLPPLMIGGTALPLSASPWLTTAIIILAVMLMAFCALMREILILIIMPESTG